MKPRVYLETTIPSYLTAWPSRDLVRAAHQQITRDWWDKRRMEFELYISQVVLRECQAGDALHVAIAAVHGMEYLLTRNCTHIANATLRDPIESVCRRNGYEPPAICTPDELLAEEGD